jgi:hypothetical protein
LIKTAAKICDRKFSVLTGLTGGDQSLLMEEQYVDVCRTLAGVVDDNSPQNVAVAKRDIGNDFLRQRLRSGNGWCA